MKQVFVMGVVALMVGCAGANRVENSEKYDAAATAYKNGELSQAETLYRSIAEKHPDYAEAWFKLGNIYVRTEQYDAAVTMYEHAAKINPEDAKTWNNLALARVKQAIAVLDEGVSHGQKDSAQVLSMRDLRQRIVQSVIAEH